MSRLRIDQLPKAYQQAACAQLAPKVLKLERVELTKKPTAKSKAHAWQTTQALAYFEANRLPTPVCEHRFHDERRWRFDFAFLEHKVAVECEGGVWSNGRHTRGKGFIEDCSKYSEAAILGWCVIRRATADLLTPETIDMIQRAIQARTKKAA